MELARLWPTVRIYNSHCPRIYIFYPLLLVTFYSYNTIVILMATLVTLTVVYVTLVWAVPVVWLRAGLRLLRTSILTKPSS